jgi:hypothetical protein
MGFSLLLLSPLTRYGKFGKQKKGGKEELGLRHKHESFLGDCHRTGFLLNPTNCFFFFLGGGVKWGKEGYKNVGLIPRNLHRVTVGGRAFLVFGIDSDSDRSISK